MQRRVPVAGLLLAMLGAWLLWREASPGRAAEPAANPAAAPAAIPAGDEAGDPSPVDVALLADGELALAANHLAGTVALVSLTEGKVLDEVAVGERPAAIIALPEDRGALVTTQFGGELIKLSIAGGKLQVAGRVRLSFEPMGVAVSLEGREAYVALAAASAVSVVDLATMKEAARIEVGAWPRYLALSPDGTRLAVGEPGARAVSVIDTKERKRLFQQSVTEINYGHMQISADGQHVYFPAMVYRQNPIDVRNIRLGWVLASRLCRVALDKADLREAVSLDPPGVAISDPHGMALTPDGEWLVASAGGTHELLVYRRSKLKFMSVGGPGDHIERDLLADKSSFYRIPLPGRPMGLRLTADGRRAVTANYLDNSLQVVNLAERRVEKTISLGGPQEASLARQGEAIFYDGRRSLDQWYSCHTCHYEGGANAVKVDTHNDGSVRTFKTVLPMFNIAHTPPYTWHGWQKDLAASMHKSMLDTMIGPAPTEGDVKALLAWLETLRLPPNPYRQADGSLSEAAQRGQKVFQSEVAGCNKCHSGPWYTDGQIHDVGQGSLQDVYSGYNTPSLLGAHRRVLLLHHGRATNFDELLTEYHNPKDVTGHGELTDAQRADLIEFLKSL